MSGSLIVMNKTLLITGASRGLGKFLSLYFAKLNFDLILVASDLKRLKELSNEIKLSKGQRLLIIPVDFSLEGFEVDMFKKVYNFCPCVDVLINNAAIQGPIGPFTEIKFDNWEIVFKINFLAPALISQKIIKNMKKNGGTIINLSGGGGASLRPNFSAYSASKAALIRFSETIAEELKKNNINVNTIAPGIMPTDMMKEILKVPKNVSIDQEKKIAKDVLSKSSNMKVVADLCRFLTTSKARLITGKLISAKWDNWKVWTNNLEELNSSDLYTLRRIVGHDRGVVWGDK